MASLRLTIDDTTLYEGPTIAVPRAGEDVHHDGKVVRVEAVTWDFRTADVVQVALVVGGESYTF
jgi:hypothetical protein